MTGMLLMFAVCGTVALALIIDAAVLASWLRKRARTLVTACQDSRNIAIEKGTALYRRPAANAPFRMSALPHSDQKEPTAVEAAGSLVSVWPFRQPPKTAGANPMRTSTDAQTSTDEL